MNVSAQIIGEVVPNALCIPVDAVERGNTVTVPGPGALSEDGLSVVDVTKLETKEVTLVGTMTSISRLPTAWRRAMWSSSATRLPV